MWDKETRENLSQTRQSLFSDENYSGSRAEFRCPTPIHNDGYFFLLTFGVCQFSIEKLYFFVVDPIAKMSSPTNFPDAKTGVNIV